MADQPSAASGHRARLRQRLFDGGPKALLDHELIEYLLALTIPRVDTKPLARRLIDQFGGVGALLNANAETLKREGLSEAAIGALKIAEATALRLLETRVEGRPILSSWQALGDYLQAAMAHSSVEEVRVLFLNRKRSRSLRIHGERTTIAWRRPSGARAGLIGAERLRVAV